jgi:hypothetical protein
MMCRPPSASTFVVALLPLRLHPRLLQLGGVLREQVQLGLERAAEHDVGTAAGHVGGDGDRLRAAGLGDDMRLALVLLGVEHFVRDAGGGELVGEQFRGLDRGGADQRRLAALVAVLDVLDHGVELRFLGQVDEVGAVLADHRAVGRDHHHFQAVDGLEFVGLGVRRAGHARQLGVHAEVVLEGDRGEGLVLALDRHAFLGLDRLVQAVGPAPALQRAAGEFVDDDDLAVAHDVVDVALVQRVRAQAGVEVVHHGQVVGRVQRVALGDDAVLAQQLLGVLHAALAQVHLLLLLVDEVVAFLAVFLFLLRQARDHPVDAHVQLGRLVGRAGDDQRRARLVDQDRVDLVDDRVEQAALVAVFLRQRHVVAQVVEAVLVVGAVGDVGGVGALLVGMRHARVDHAHAHAQEVVQLAHPGGVAARQVVVDGDQVHALAGQRIEVHRQGRHQGLAFAGAHLRDAAGVQHHAADQLHVVVAHAEHPPGCLATDREGFRQQVVEGGAARDALAELVGLGLQRAVVQPLQLRFQGIDLRDVLVELAEQAIVAAAEDAGKQAVEHGEVRSWASRWNKGGHPDSGGGAGHFNVGRARAISTAGRKNKTPRSGGVGTARKAPALAQVPTLSRPTLSRNGRGLTGRPLTWTSKCTCGPVERPVEPALASCWPARTISPTRTTSRELWPYRVV